MTDCDHPVILQRYLSQNKEFLYSFAAAFNLITQNYHLVAVCLHTLVREHFPSHVCSDS